MKGNVINLNTLHLNSVRLNGIGKVQSVSLKGGSTEDPVFPPVEPPVEPEPTPTYTLSASVANGVVSATLNGVVVSLPFTANEGDVIVVQVTPNDGYEFNGWADGNTDNPRSITMNADVALSAECSEVVQPPVGNYIQFEDKAVEAICVENWSSDGIGLTEEDAAAVTSIGTTFKGNTEITTFNELRYFTKVTSIPTNAFDACSNLRSIGVNWGEITSIGANAFRNCSSLQLEEVAAPKLTNLGSAAFHGIPALKRATDLGFVPSVALKTFYNTGLLFINLPATITSIGSQVFRYVTSLEQVIVRATTPPSLDSLTFQNTNDTFLIYVPDASLEAYKGATNWVSFADRIHPLSEIEGSLVFYDKLVGDGFAHINTEYYPKGTDSFAWDAERPKYYNKFIFGSKSSAFNVGALASNETQTYYLVGPTTATAVSEDNSQRVVRSMQVLAIDGSLHRVLTDNGVQTKDFGALGSYADKTSSSPLLLFACQISQSSASPDRLYQGAIHSFAITDIDGNTIMSLKPCTWNGEAGMWDEVGNKFYGNAVARGEFSVAND